VTLAGEAAGSLTGNLEISELASKRRINVEVVERVTGELSRMK